MAIDVAIIDSGVNPWHSHVGGVVGGVSLRIAQSGEVLQSEDFRDELGHGTAIAGVIREKVPQATLYAVKIFYRKLEAPTVLLLAALEWAINKQTKIIHLSLGTERLEYRSELKRLCRRAYRNDIIIVAAARNSDDQVYPGVFGTVIGVYWNHDCDKDTLSYHPEKAIEFGAYGRPRDLPGLPRELNLCGSSFAAAHVTAMVARFLERNPVGGILWVKDMLKKKAKGDIGSNGT